MILLEYYVIACKSTTKTMEALRKYVIATVIKIINSVYNRTPIDVANTSVHARSLVTVD